MQPIAKLRFQPRALTRVLLWSLLSFTACNLVLIPTPARAQSSSQSPISAAPAAPTTPVSPAAETDSPISPAPISAPSSVGTAQAALPNIPEPPAVKFKPIAPRTYPRPADTWLEAQIALARRGISSGPIDGVAGSQSAAALGAFQKDTGLPTTGTLDDATKNALQLDRPPLIQIALTADDLASLQPLEKTWLGKSQQTTLAHETALELIAERTHSSTRFIETLNPAVKWKSIAADTPLSVPDVMLKPLAAKIARVEVRLAERVLQARDDAGKLLLHFPVSIAKNVEKRPIGELHVTVVIAEPNYTFDPATFTESEEARSLGRKLILPPGPNNPVGEAWIGLDRPGYGIHGTPTPEHVGRTESHGCFRLANWDALTLVKLAWVGLPITVSP